MAIAYHPGTVVSGIQHLPLAQRASHAGEVFRAARRVTQAKGVVARLPNEFDGMVLADRDGILAPVRKDRFRSLEPLTAVKQSSTWGLGPARLEGGAMAVQTSQAR